MSENQEAHSRSHAPWLPPVEDWTWVVIAVLLCGSLSGTTWAVSAGITLGKPSGPNGIFNPYVVPTLGVFAIPVFLAAAAMLFKPASILLRVATIVVLGIALLAPAIASPAQYVGDSGEYYQMLTAVMSHGTVDIRQSDTQKVGTIVSTEDWWTPDGDPRLQQSMKGGVYASRSGYRYSWHFALNSIAAVPFAFAVQLLGRPWVRGFQVLNAALILLAFYGLLYWSGLRDFTSRAFAAFWILSPVIWYIAWPSAEVWSASMVVLAIVFFTRKQYALATLLAALAAVQNPPLLLFVLLIGVVGAMRVWKTSGLAGVWPIGLAAAVALLPNAFFMVTFGTPNLIAKMGFASLHFITLAKVVSLFTDLNQGILPFAPALLIMWLVAIGLSIYRRSWFGIALAITTVLMAALTTMSPNWNSGSAGIMRYAIWLLPVMAWNVFAMLRPSRRPDRLGAVTLVAAQGAIALAVIVWPSYVPDLRIPTPIAMFVLERAPWAYSPVPEIFAERSSNLHVDGATVASSPALVEDPKGRVLKVLLSATQAQTVASYLGIPIDEVRGSMYSSGQPGLYYFDVPAGARE